MEQNYTYIDLRATGIPDDMIEVRIQSDGIRYINLNGDMTRHLHDKKLSWVNIAIGDSDGATYLEFVRDKDSYSAPIVENYRVRLPSEIMNARAVEHIISLLDNPYDGMRVGVSEDITPDSEVKATYKLIIEEDKE